MFKINQISTGVFQKSQLKELHSKITLQLKPKTLTLLLGPNGIGKSVFLKTLLNIYKPIEGSLTINDIVISNIPNEELAQYISLMLPTSPQIEFMSAFNIAMSGRHRFTQPWQLNNLHNQKIVEHYFCECNISHLMHSNFAQLSDGEKQKVMLVRCLSQETPIILLDEPMAFLDYPSRIQFLSLIKKIAQEQNKYVILSTHDIEISLPFADQILALTKGQFQVFNHISDFSPELIFSENP